MQYHLCKSAVCAAIVIFQASCMIDARVHLHATKPDATEITATVQTGRSLFSVITGEQFADERWYEIQYQVEDGKKELSVVSLSQIPEPPPKGQLIIVDGVDVNSTDIVETPKVIAATGYSAADKSDNLYLCTKSNRRLDMDWPWAVITADGKTKAEIQSISPKSLGSMFYDHTWNPATSQVAFRGRIDIVPPPNADRSRLNPVAVNVWTYKDGTNTIDSYTLDLSQAFELRDKRYVPKKEFQKSAE